MPEISAGREKKPAMRAFFVFVLRDWPLSKQEFRPKRMRINDSVKRRNKKNRNPAIAVQKESVILTLHLRTAFVS